MSTRAFWFSCAFAGRAMRGAALMSCFVLTLFVPGFSQQPPSETKKILTPEQQALQQQIRDLDAKRATLRAQAKQAFDAEMARAKGGDCKTANNTYEFNVCFGKAAEAADQNLKSYEDAIRALLGLKYPDLTGRPPVPGPAGPALTPEQEVAGFDRVEQLWHSYLDASTSAAFHQFGGGTGGPSFEMETHLRLVRSHMTELDNLYGMLLHL